MRHLPFIALSLIAAPCSAQLEYDAKILEYTGLKYACPGGGTPILKIINEGSVTMSGCVVETWKNGIQVNSFDWQLAVPAAQGDIRQPVLPDVADVEPGDVLEFRIISVNEIPDQGPDGNILEVPLDGLHATTSGTEVVVKVETDDAPADLTWEIRNDLNQLVAGGGPYEDPDEVILEPVLLDPSGCYSFKALDSGRDVSTGARIQVLGGANTLLSVEGAALLAGEKLGLSTGNGAACSHPLTMELHTDGSPEETSWEITDPDNGAIVCMGSGAYQADAYITENCCLSEGCYRLRVLDSGGDGMTTGGYVLRTTDSNLRIIDDGDNFNGVYDGDESAISGGQTFCVPLGTDRTIFTSCDKLDWVTNRFIMATANPVVSAQYNVTNTTSGYEFWFFDPNGSYSFRRFRSHATSDGYGTGATRACHFRINAWTNMVLTPHIPANVLLNVRIRGRVANANLPFGPACRFKIDPVLAACPRVKLQDNPASNDFSCGVNKVFGGANSAANRITATPPQPVPAVASSNVRYQFRFRIPGEGICIVRPPQTSPTLHLNWSAQSGPQLQCNRPYEVDVRVSLDGGASWCFDAANPSCVESVTEWGKVCNVNITTSTFCPGEFAGPGSSLSPSGDGQATLYPNPVAGDRVFVSLQQVDPSADRATLDVFDRSGALVMTGTFAVVGGGAATVLELPATLPSGLYLVQLQAGGSRFVERLSLQR